jgi:hypothetical protein
MNIYAKSDKCSDINKNKETLHIIIKDKIVIQWHIVRFAAPACIRIERTQNYAGKNPVQLYFLQYLWQKLLCRNVRKSTKLYTKTAIFDQIVYFFGKMDFSVVALRIFLSKNIFKF